MKNSVSVEYSENSSSSEYDTTFRTCEQFESTEMRPSTSQDLVIFTSINAKNLKICRVNCLNCCPNSTLEIYRDANLYLNILQLILCLIILSITSINAKIIYEFITIDGEELLNYVNDSCHVALATLSLSIINLITILLVVYDGMQAQKGSTRLNDLIFALLIWSGGWPSAWLLFYLFNYRIYYGDESILVKPKKTLLAILTGFSIPTMLLAFSNNSITQI